MRETTFQQGKVCAVRLMPADGDRGPDIEIIADTVKEQVRAGRKVCTFLLQEELVGRFERVDNWWVKQDQQAVPPRSANGQGSPGDESASRPEALATSG